RADVDVEGPCDQPIGEPSVLWQQRSVEICADCVTGASALETAVAVVTVTFEHPAQRGDVRAEIRTAAMVLKAREHTLFTVEVYLDRNVPDQPLAWLAHGA